MNNQLTKDNKMEKRKCKTCGRTVGQYAYGGKTWHTVFDQRVGKK